MNKFNIIGTVKVTATKQFKRGETTCTLMRFQITYPINTTNTKMTTFMCSTFNQDVVKKLKTGDYVELTEYIPTSDKYRNNQGQFQYFNSLIVKDLEWRARNENFGELEQEMLFSDFDVNSYQENYGADDALAEVPKEEIDYFGMLREQQEIINNQPETDITLEVVLNDEQETN